MVPQHWCVTPSSHHILQSHQHTFKSLENLRNSCFVTPKLFYFYKYCKIRPCLWWKFLQENLSWACLRESQQSSQFQIIGINQIRYVSEILLQEKIPHSQLSIFCSIFYWQIGDLMSSEYDDEVVTWLFDRNKSTNCSSLSSIGPSWPAWQVSTPLSLTLTALIHITPDINSNLDLVPSDNWQDLLVFQTWHFH